MNGRRMSLDTGVAEAGAGEVGWASMEGCEVETGTVGISETGEETSVVSVETSTPDERDGDGDNSICFVSGDTALSAFWSVSDLNLMGGSFDNPSMVHTESIRLREEM